MLLLGSIASATVAPMTSQLSWHVATCDEQSLDRWRLASRLRYRSIDVAATLVKIRCSEVDRWFLRACTSGNRPLAAFRPHLTFGRRRVATNRRRLGTDEHAANQRRTAKLNPDPGECIAPARQGDPTRLPPRRPGARSTRRQPVWPLALSLSIIERPPRRIPRLVRLAGFAGSFFSSIGIWMTPLKWSLRA